MSIPLKLGYVLIIVLLFGSLAVLYQFQLTKLQDKLEQLESNQNRNEVILRTEKNIIEDKDLVILYNRVPKTGSTSFVGVAYDLCKKNKFHVLHVNISANSHTVTLENQIKFIHNVTNWRSIKPALYHGHFAFFDFSKFGASKPLFINLIRKPLDRFISYYYFVRYGDNYRPYLIRKKHGNTMTFEECVNKQLPECDPNNMWLQIPFFCGHAANCWKPGNKWALNEAKKNLINNYFLVGLTEQLEEFIQLLELSLPRFFKGATDHFQHSNRSHLRQTVQKDLPSEETLEKIKTSTVWQMENEFYDFALDQFNFVKKFIMKNKGQVVMYEKIRPKV
ncbi:heparin sulfate O-sulfotransferase isoform X1 [Diorhabda sublineata]|uniref:heparin sulfate O-sulfotransferase isoform X1 n=1 Tax=Diorhabda sublineata TaxID=1163346 RepID=UPI0024E0A980|nr:heparin sulfate O-sulfotransferase isoform X1 [Diorhabda sublineata]